MSVFVFLPDKAEVAKCSEDGQLLNLWTLYGGISEDNLGEVCISRTGLRNTLSELYYYHACILARQSGDKLFGAKHYAGNYYWLMSEHGVPYLSEIK